MKKFILPLLLILSIGLLIAAESEASDVVGYVKYECLFTPNGSNTLIALPMGTQFATASAIGDAYPGIINVITGWNPDNQVWAAASKVGDTWYGDFNVYPGMSYMVTVTETVDFYSMGDLNAPVEYTLVSNANGSNSLIMVPLNRSDLAEADDLGDDVGVVSVVTKWDNTNQVWTAASKVGETWFGNYGISIAMPLMVTVTEATTWGGAEEPPTRSVAPQVNSRSKK